MTAALLILVFWKEARTARRLLGSGDFVDDGLGGSARIFRGEDGPADNDEVRTGFDGFRWTRGARLVIVFWRRAIFLFGPHAWCDNQEFPAAGFANRPRFLHRCDDTV